MCTYSKDYISYKKKKKKEKILVFLIQILILLTFLIIWQFLDNKKLINSFLYSSPKRIISCIINLYKQNNLFGHISITLKETVTSFILSTLLGLTFAIILWWSNLLEKIIDPYLTIINSLPKVALGPLIIIWVGANTYSIIFMALLISTISTTINIYNGFIQTNKNYILLLKSFKACKLKIFTKAIFPSNILNIISTLKINISLTLIGVIMGELLVSKEGLGYLIMYGSQIFNITLVITSIFILGIFSYLLYLIIHYIEKKLTYYS